MIKAKYQQKFLPFFIFLTITLCSSLFARTVLITGGNRGIGLALVKEYLGYGDYVYTTYRCEENFSGLLGLENKRLTTIKVDFTDDNCEKIISNVIADNALDIIIHNAGFFAHKTNYAPILDKTEWLNSFKINAIVPVTLTLALLDNLRKGTDKKVIVISSRRGSNSINTQDKYIGRFAYRSSKAALNSAAIALSEFLKEDQITTIMLHPGRVATKMTKFDGIDPSQSAQNIISVISEVTLADSNKFIDAETNQILPW